ncbi:MAG: nicotinate-nucleotide--dimethylbenzimidazole phosphoribosyltransferase [Solirubrobacteraceae bacterium]
MAAGPGPLSAPRRPPIPIRPLDAEAMAAARAAGASELAVWLAGAAGPQVRVRIVAVAPRPWTQDPPEVPEVAAAVDEGRAGVLEAAATVLVVTGGDADAAARLTAALAAGPDRPLRALRRAGTHDLALLCGLALGAGEHGLAFVADGRAVTAAAQLAIALEPDLGPRVRTLGEPLAELSGRPAPPVG